jgi:hypothetical protein
MPAVRVRIAVGVPDYDRGGRPRLVRIVKVDFLIRCAPVGEAAVKGGNGVQAPPHFVHDDARLVVGGRDDELQRAGILQGEQDDIDGGGEGFSPAPTARGDLDLRTAQKPVALAV